MKSTREQLLQSEQYLNFLKKRLASENYKNNVSKEEYEKTKAKYDKEKLKYKFLKQKGGS
jgi:hypothetical protein